MSDDLTVLGPDGIKRGYGEHYDTMRDVEQDPCGAHQAIQKLADRIDACLASSSCDSSHSLDPVDAFFVEGQRL